MSSLDNLVKENKTQDIERVEAEENIPPSTSILHYPIWQPLAHLWLLSI